MLHLGFLSPETNNTSVLFFPFCCLAPFVQVISPSMFIVNEETYQCSHKSHTDDENVCIECGRFIVAEWLFFLNQKVANFGQ